MSEKNRIHVMWGAFSSEECDRSVEVAEVLEHIERSCRRKGISLGLGQWCEDLRGDDVVPLEACDSLLVGIADGDMDVELWCSSDSAGVCFDALRVVEVAINDGWGQAQIWINGHYSEKVVMMRLEHADSMTFTAFVLLFGRDMEWDGMC